MSTPNVFNTTSLIANQITDYFEEFSAIVATSNDYYQRDWDRRDLAVGNVINCKFVGYPPVQTGLSVTASPIEDYVIPFTITQDDIYSVTRNLDTQQERLFVVGGDRALTKQDQSKIVDNYAMPAFQSLNASLELKAASKLNIYSMYTPIDSVDKLTSFNSFSYAQQLTTFFDAVGLPNMDRYLMMNTYDASQLAASQQNQFNPALNKMITDNAYINGTRTKGRFAGFDTFISASLVTPFSAGSLSGVSGITVANVSPDGTQITLQGVPSTTAQIVNAGDMFSIGGVKLLNYLYKQSNKYGLVGKALTNSNGNGDGTVTVNLAFPLMFTGEHAWIDSLPVSGAPVVFYPNRYNNYGYTKQGVSLGSLEVMDIAGAENSKILLTSKDERMGKRLPFKVIVQGANLELANNYRVVGWAAIQPFTPYIANIPTLAQ